MIGESLYRVIHSSLTRLWFVKVFNFLLWNPSHPLMQGRYWLVVCSSPDYYSLPSFDIRFKRNWICVPLVFMYICTRLVINTKWSLVKWITRRGYVKRSQVRNDSSPHCKLYFAKILPNPTSIDELNYFASSPIYIAAIHYALKLTLNFESHIAQEWKYKPSANLYI